MLNLNEIERNHEIATTKEWWSERDRCKAIAKLLEQVPVLVAELQEARAEIERLRAPVPSPDCSKKKVAIVMLYTGWTREMAESAIEQWRQVEPRWTADYMKHSLSARQLERLEELTDDTTVDL